MYADTTDRQWGELQYLVTYAAWALLLPPCAVRRHLLLWKSAMRLWDIDEVYNGQSIKNVLICWSCRVYFTWKPSSKVGKLVIHPWYCVWLHGNFIFCHLKRGNKETPWRQEAEMKRNFVGVAVGNRIFKKDWYYCSKILHHTNNYSKTLKTNAFLERKSLTLRR